MQTYSFKTGSRETRNNNVLNQQQSLFFKPSVQPSLIVNPPNDVYEQEANAAAERIMQTPALQQPILPPSPIQLKEDANQTATPSLTENPVSSLRGGKPLSHGERSFFEPRMGYDFSNVRLHNDIDANHSAKNINALAYTTGNNIVFGSDQYQPNTSDGKKLLAHELTHVIQQKGSRNTVQRLVRKSDVKDCTDQSDKPSADLLAAEQKAFDLLRKGIDRIQTAEDEYREAMHKYLGPTLSQLEQFKEASEIGKSLRAVFGVSANEPGSWDKLHIVKIRFMGALSWLNDVVFQYVCVNSGDMCPEKRDAFVDTSKDHRTINLCPKFWETDPTERGFTIAHEIMHLWGGGFMKDTTETTFGITKVTPRFQDVNRYEKFLRLIVK